METNGKLQVDKAKLINLLGSKMYRGDVCSVAVKELLQNAFDAVKIAKAMNPQLNPEISVIVNNAQRTITVVDNGIGMTPEIVQNAFFTIGGSDKGNVSNSLKSGGLGLAKMAFLFSSEEISLITNRNGIETTVKCTPEQIQNDDFKIVSNHFDSPSGTEVTVKIPEYYTDDNGEKRYIWMQTPSILSKPLIYSGITLRVNDKVITTRAIPDGYASLGTAKAAFGDIEIFVKPNKSSSLCAKVHCSGLFQFTKNFYIDNTKIDVILNILPSVDTKHQLYPINNTREGFNVSVDPEIKDIEFLLKKLNRLMEKKSAREMFENKISQGRFVESVTIKQDPEAILNDSIKAVRAAMFERPNGVEVSNTVNLKTVRIIRDAEKNRDSTLDLSGIHLEELETAPIDMSSLDINKAVFHNNTNLIITEDCKQFLESLGDLVVKMRNMLVEIYGSSITSPRQYMGISLDKRYYGVHVSPSVFNFIGINPFYPIEVTDKSNSVEAIVEATVHTLCHELAHNNCGWHNESFCQELQRVYTCVAGLGVNYQDWRDTLRNLIRNNIITIVGYIEKFKTCSNVDDGFDVE